jgi:hypothetical protein
MKKQHEKILVATLAGLVIASFGALAAQPALTSGRTAPTYDLGKVGLTQPAQIMSQKAWAQLQG